MRTPLILVTLIQLCGFFANMEAEEHIQVPAAPAVLVDTSVKLPASWPTDIATWSASTEGIFDLQSIISQQARYFNVLAALSTDNSDPDRQPAHRHSERVEKLLAMLAIGQQKLLQLLAKMLRISL